MKWVVNKRSRLRRRGSEIEGLRLLGRMRMGRTGVTLELLDHRVAERALGQHSLHSLFERAAGKAGLHLAERRRPDASGIAAMPVIKLVLGLVARHAQLFDVRDDDEVARVHMRREDGLVLAA